jgi:mRNA-degrading endonuclease RelE of RelBE toxin-antitoxin system
MNSKGVHSARRGAFRVLYEIDDGVRLVTVFRVEHRAGVYRPR